MESLDGTLERKIGHWPNKFNPSGAPYLIGRLSSGRVVKGQMRAPVEGESYRFFGEWKDQKKYEQAFEFHSYEPILPKAGSGLASAIAAHVVGLGPARSAAIVEEFGEDTLAVLRNNPERAMEIRGITPAIVLAIKEWLDDHSTYDPAAYARLVELFDGHRIPKRVVESLLKHWGSDAPGLVIDNPYILLAYPRLGWKTVDAIAMTSCSYPPEGLMRHSAAVLEALERIAGEGHTVATASEIATQAEGLLGQALHPEAIEDLIAEGEIIPWEDEHGTVYQLSTLADAEAEIAERIATLFLADGLEFEAGLLARDWSNSVGLGDDQAAAALMVECHSVAAITGPPGTGKTYTLSRILGRLSESGITGIRVVAPTGKAAKRAAELLSQVPGLSGVPCTTIHKALSPTPNTETEGVPAKEAKFRRGREEFGFGRNESTPLEDQIIVIDECSMVDVRLMASFLRAVKPGTRLIIVGDPNQLPSVGAGSVLRDLLAAGVPHVELTQIRRSDGGGRVVRACHAIKDGRVPEPAESIALPTENWIHIELSDPNEIAAKITDIHRELKALGADPMWDVQAISAQRGKLAFGCDALNGRLSSYLNCPSPIRTDRDDDYERIGFRPGDKIVRTANGVADELRESDGFEAAEFYWRGEEWKASPCPVVNGDMGEVLDIVTEPKPGIVVRFRDPERLCRLPLGEHNLVQAYAMTVHKCQGSGFPFVVVPVHQAFYWDARKNTGLFSRELLYTAISRAERLLVTVGQWSAVVAAVGRKTVHQRQTTLAARLKMQKEGVANVPF